MKKVEAKMFVLIDYGLIAILLLNAGLAGRPVYRMC